MWRTLHASALLLGLVAACGGATAGRPTTPPVAGAVERSATIDGRRLRYHLHLEEQANLVYQLDCIAGSIICSQAIYREHWAALGLDAEDEAALAAWKELRARHEGEIRPAAGLRPPQAILASSGVFDLGERKRIAGLRARTPDEYQAAIALLSTDADARRMRELMERFAPRFAAWWRQRGFASGSAFFDGFQRLLADPFFDSTVDAAARFYEADLPPGTVFHLHLVVQPRSARKLLVAYQLEGDAAVEAPEGGRPEGPIDVAAHELFHYLFFRMDPRRQAALLDKVCASEDPFAVASFGMLDEAVAAALGNGVVGRHYSAPEAFARSRDRGFVQYRAAGAVARELLPSLPGFLDRGTTVSSDEFLGAFLTAARATFPGGRPRPLDYLHNQVSVADPRFAAAAQRLRDAAWAGFPYLRVDSSLEGEARSYLQQHPFMNAAIFLSSESDLSAALGPLAGKDGAGIAALARRSRGFVYALPRSPKSYAFLFVAADVVAMQELVDRFIALPPSGERVLVDLPR